MSSVGSHTNRTYSRLQIQRTRIKRMFAYNERTIESHFFPMYLLHFELLCLILTIYQFVVSGVDCTSALHCIVNQFLV